MRPIDADALKKSLLEERDKIPHSFGCPSPNKHGAAMRGGIRKALRCMENTPTLDYAPVKHGVWKLEVNAFYKDNPFEEIDLCIYILAKCGNCGRMHPDTHQVYSKDLYAEGDNNHPFDVEYEKRVALKEFRERGHLFANYCPSCGALMDGKPI